MIKLLRTKEAKELTKNEVLLVIYRYLTEQENLTIREMTNQDNFSNSSWAEMQAYKLGMLKAFAKIKDFLPDQGALID